MADNVSITYNGLTMTSTSAEYTLTGGSGFNGLDNRVSEANLLGRDGGRVFSRKDSMRTIVLEGMVNGPTPDDFFASKSILMAAFNNKSSSDLVVTLWDSAATTRRIPAKVVQEPLIEYEGGITTRGRFQVILRGENSYWLDPIESSITLSLEQVQGFDLPVTLPFDILGGSGTSQGTIDNIGDVSIFPSITINAGDTLINPTLTNLTTGGAFQINATLIPGDVVVVAYGPSGVSATLNGSTNYYSNLLGDLFKLQTGVNAIRFSASSFDVSSNAIVAYSFGYRQF